MLETHYNNEKKVSQWDALTLSDPTSNLVRQYRSLSEPVRRFSSCSTGFSQQIAQVVLFLILYDFLF
jgi:hypothetical protein